MSEGYWLKVTRRQLLYIIEGCQIDKPLVEHWVAQGQNSPLMADEANMGQTITSLERNARDALYRGMDGSRYPPGDERRRKQLVH